MLCKESWVLALVKMSLGELLFEGFPKTFISLLCDIFVALLCFFPATCKIILMGLSMQKLGGAFKRLSSLKTFTSFLRYENLWCILYPHLRIANRLKFSPEYFLPNYYNSSGSNVNNLWLYRYWIITTIVIHKLCMYQVNRKSINLQSSSFSTTRFALFVCNILYC